ncbi:MAG: hypothetical protein K8J08_17425 [Thermoanaerobaculia bacterium]|nr:hypothetical protein [Thermoanaerobaculia bacterium]
MLIRAFRNRVFLIGFSWLALIGGLATQATAQYWQGRAVVELHVSGARSGSVAGAQVDLAFLEGNPVPGPQGLQTDNKGDLTVSGLAEGRWQIRVSHPDFFSFVTVVVVEIDRKVDVLEAAHEASRTGSGLLRLKFDKVRAGVGAAVPSSRPRPDPAAPAPVPPVTRPVAVPEEAVRVTHTPPEVEAAAPEAAAPEAKPSAPETPVSAPPKTDPVPSDTPTPEAAPVESLPADPAPVVEPVPVLAPAPAEPTPAEPEPVVPKPAESKPVESTPADAPPAARVEPSPEPPPAPVVMEEVSAEEVATESEPMSVPRQSATVRSWDLGTCHDCRPGESALSIETTVDPGRGTCVEGAEEAVRSAVQLIGSEGVSILKGFFGPLSSSRLVAATDRLSSTTGERVRELLAPFEEGSCQVMVAILPASARFTGYRYEARDFAAGGDCLPDQDCPIGDAQWLGNPGIVRGEGFSAFWTTFSNRSQDRARHPRLSVYFQGR